MQAKFFRPVPCSIDAASIQILLIAVCDVTVLSHLSKLYFYSIKITWATGKLINIDKLTFD